MKTTASRRKRELGVEGVVTFVRQPIVCSIAQDQHVVVAPEAVTGGIAAEPAIGAVAGLYLALRAARLSPTEARRTG